MVQLILDWSLKMRTKQRIKNILCLDSLSWNFVVGHQPTRPSGTCVGDVGMVENFVERLRNVFELASSQKPNLPFRLYLLRQYIY